MKNKLITFLIVSTIALMYGAISSMLWVTHSLGLVSRGIGMRRLGLLYTVAVSLLFTKIFSMFYGKIYYFYNRKKPTAKLRIYLNDFPANEDTEPGHRKR